MKEATGEANITVITIVLVAIVLAVGTVIVNNIMTSSSKKAACSEAGGMWYSNACKTKCVGDDKGGYSCSGTDLTCSQKNGVWTCK